MCVLATCAFVKYIHRLVDCGGIKDNQLGNGFSSSFGVSRGLLTPARSVCVAPHIEAIRTGAKTP